MEEPASTPSERLFVGNLASQVDEYALTQLFRKHGKIVSLDFPFHRQGPLRGKARGFAFVQYETTAQALKAILELHDKTLRGRRIIVSPANEAPDVSSQPLKPPKKQGSRTDEEKIKALEAKLHTMRKEPTSSGDPSLPAKPAPPRR